MTASSAALVYVIAMPGAPPVAPVVAAVRAELRGVIAIAADALVRPPIAGAIYLVWSAPGIEPTRWSDLVSWSAVAEPRPGLIACIPGGAQGDAEHGLDAGFDDVVVGVLSTRELAARVRAVHRRVHWNGLACRGRLRHGALTLHLDSHELWLDGVAIALTSTEVAVLRALIRARGRTLSRSEILDAAWHDDQLEVSERAVDNVILRLRRKLPRLDLIQTVRGVGFRLGE